MLDSDGVTAGPIAFVLSGGGSIGSIQVGMLHALYERGVRPDFIVASSAGALIGAFLASRPATVTTAQELGRIWSELRSREVFPIRLSVDACSVSPASGTTW